MSRLSHLPADAVQLLAEWIADYQTLIYFTKTLSEFSRYKDPNHRLWKQLYHRYISTYPPPPGATYKDRYIAGCELAAKQQYSALSTRIASEGYDVLLKPWYIFMSDSIYEEVMSFAAYYGYLSMITDSLAVGKTISRVRAGELLDRAAAWGHLKVVEYLVEKYHLTHNFHSLIMDIEWSRSDELVKYLLDRMTKTDTSICDVAEKAGRYGSLDLLQHVLSLVEAEQLALAESSALSGAAHNTQPQLVEWLLDRKVRVELIHLDEARTSNMYLTLFRSRSWMEDELILVVDHLAENFDRAVNIELAAVLEELKNNIPALMTLRDLLTVSHYRPLNVHLIESFILTRL